MPDHNAADCRRRHELNLIILEVFGDRAAKPFRLRRMLQQQRTLKIVCAVQSAGQNEVALEQSPGRSKSFDYCFSFQVSPQ